MISISPISSASGASKYYLEDEQHLDLNDMDEQEKAGDNENNEKPVNGRESYYLGDNQGTEWFGKLATESGLEGKPIKEKTLTNVLSGILLNEQIHGKRDNHRSGFDLTFSAPKSVSILALAGGDERLADAHNKAVKYALSEIEKDTAQIKFTDKDTKKQGFKNTQNMLFGLVQHQTSREDDPQLHTHALTSNMTRAEDGKLRALATNLKQSGNEINGTFERIYSNQKYYTSLYQSSLANAAEKLGYSVESTGKGLFEIVGVPKNLIDAFSKRNKQINKESKNVGFDSPKAKDIIAKNTRKEKTHANFSELNKTWQATIIENGFDIKDFIAKSKEAPTKPQDSLLNIRAVESIDRAISHLSETKNSLPYEKIISSAYTDFTKGERIDVVELKSALDKKIKNNELIPLDKNSSRFTTSTLIENEKKLLSSTEGRAQNMRTLTNDAALSQLGLSKNNEKKITSVFSSTKQFNTINVFGSSETLAKSLLHVGTESGKRIHILTPDSMTKIETNKNVTRESHTVMQWVKNAFRKDNTHSVNQFLSDKTTPFSNKDILIFENSGKLSTKNLLDITDKAKESNSKVIFLNRASSRQGMKSNSSMDILDKGNTYSSNWVNEKQSNANVSLHNENVNDLVNLYVSKSNKDNVEVLASTNKNVKTLNSAIRDKLKQTGEVSRVGFNVETLNPHFLSKEQKEIATHYKSNMVLQFWEKENNKSVMSQYSVIKHDRKNNLVHLMGDNKNELVIDPSNKKHNFSIHTKDEIELSKGDKVRSNAKHFSTGIKEHQEFHVLSASDNKITLLSSDGKKTTFNPKITKDSPLSHNFATTTHKINKDKAEVILFAKSYTASKELLSELSQNKNQIDIFTENKEKIVANLDKSEFKPASIERVLGKESVTEKYLSNSTKEKVLKDVGTVLTFMKVNESTSNLEKAVSFAINHISEKEAGFSQKELVTEAIRYSMKELGKSITKPDIVAALDTNSSLLSSEFNDGTKWTTKDALSTEKGILSSLEKGRGATVPFTNKETANEFLNKLPNLTNGQKNSIQMIATTPDRFVAVQGLAGTGKSTMLESNNELISTIEALADKETKIIGLAPTHAAVNELKNKGVEAQTLQSLISDIDNGKANTDQYKNTLFLLDETSMTGNAQLKYFIDIVEKSESRAVFLGDTDQLQSLSSGKPFELAISKGALDVSYMTDIVRQKEGKLLDAVKNIIDHQPITALDNLKKQDEAKTGINKSHHVVSTFEKLTSDNKQNQLIATERMHIEVASDYLSRTPESREETLVIAYTNNERDLITSHIREGLQKEGTLGQDQVEMPRLRSIGATREEMGALMTYKKGMILTNGRDQISTILSVDQKHGLVTHVDNETGESKLFFPKNHDHKMTNLFAISKQPLAKNDLVMMRLTDKDKGIEANVPYKVSDITKGIVTLSNGSGKDLSLSSENLKDAHWDYAYTKTANMAQGATYKNVITSIKGNGNLTNIRRAYIDLTRASEHVKLYTDNEKKVIDKWLNSNDDKTSAIEIMEKKISPKEATFENKTLPVENEKYQDVNGNFDYKKMASVLKEELSERTESLATHLLGKHNESKSSKDYLTFGAGKSALKVSLTGQNRGYFKDWFTGEKGSGINLIMATESLTFKEALNFADKLINDKETPLTKNENHEKLLKTTPKNVSSLESRAADYFKESTSLKGTVGQKYLSEKGINLEDHKTIKFHPNVYSSELLKTTPAIISRLENSNGESKSIEITFLNNDGDLADVNINKRVLGSKTGSNVQINNGHNTNISILTNSIEDGLLINQTTSNSIDINSVNNKNDFQGVDKNTLRDNVIIVLNRNGEPLNDNNITKIMENLSDKNVTFIDNNNLQQEIVKTVNEIENNSINNIKIDEHKMDNDTLPSLSKHNEIESKALSEVFSNHLNSDKDRLTELDDRSTKFEAEKSAELGKETGRTFDDSERFFQKER